MSGCKKIAVRHNSAYNSLYHNPLIEKKHRRSSSDGGNMRRCLASIINEDKENAMPSGKIGKMYGGAGKENEVPNIESKVIENGKSWAKDGSMLKPSSLQLCERSNVSDSIIGLKYWESVDSENSHSVNIWDYSDSEAAPAAPWSTLPNRSLLYRPLPLDVGKCTCVIVKESSAEGLDGGTTLYTLYTNEGRGRQNRKLAVARHRRHKGRSEFRIAQNEKGIMSNSDESLIGFITANILGSKYHIWDQGKRRNFTKHSKLLAAVKFIPTVSTWTGNCRCMNAWIPKHQSMQLKNTNQIQHLNGLPTDWEMKKDKVNQLFSRIPQYNKISKQYELDFRDKGRAALQIQSSVKNFQLTLERNGRQTILQLGRVGKSKYVMDYRYPLTGYQAFCICLASIDSKLCCTV